MYRTGNTVKLRKSRPLVNFCLFSFILPTLFLFSDFEGAFYSEDGQSLCISGPAPTEVERMMLGKGMR